MPSLNHDIFTITVNIVPTAQRPNVVFMDSTRKLLASLELTICFELNTEATHNRKVFRYASLIGGIAGKGYKVEHFQLETGSRGFISQDSITF